MGVFRVLLALAVILAHTGKLFGLGLIGGVTAVQTFYMISGFYMSLILNEKYTGENAYRLFIFNRFLRLFPTYWVVLLLTVVVCSISYWTSHNALILQTWITQGRHLQIVPAFFLLLTNLIIFGQDIVMFLGVNAPKGSLYFTHDLTTSPIPAHNYLAIPQAWSLGVELLFYLIAPFIVRQSLKRIGLIILLSVTIRAVLAMSGFYLDPWLYRFFPSELSLFLLGAVAYHIYCRVRETPLKPWQKYAPLFILFGCTLAFQFIHFATVLRHTIYYGIIFACLPFVFNATRHSRWDRLVGELSYPIYICHMLVIAVVQACFPTLQQTAESWFVLICCVVTFAIAGVITWQVVEPMEQYRQRRVQKSADPSAIVLKVEYGQLT